MVIGKFYLFKTFKLLGAKAYDIEPFIWVNRIQAISVETNSALSNFIED